MSMSSSLHFVEIDLILIYVLNQRKRSVSKNIFQKSVAPIVIKEFCERFVIATAVEFD